MDKKLLGFWHGSPSVGKGAKSDPIAEAMSKQAFLVLWPDGRYNLYLGLGILAGTWTSTAVEVKLSPEMSASRAFPRTIEQEASAELMTLNIASGGSVLSTSKGPPDQKDLTFTR